MLRWFLILIFCCFVGRLNAQVNHVIGAGTFATVPMASGIWSLAQDEKTVVRFSPFVSYTLNYSRFNLSVGTGLWQSALYNELTLQQFVPFPLTSEIDYEIDYRYLFTPVTFGGNIVDKPRLKIGAEAIGMYKYLYVVKTRITTYDPFFNINEEVAKGSEINDQGFHRSGFSVGGGLYAGVAFGRFLPRIGVGYLVDLSDVHSGIFQNYSFNYPYASLSLHFMLNRPAGYEKHDRMIRW